MVREGILFFSDVLLLKAAECEVVVSDGWGCRCWWFRVRMMLMLLLPFLSSNEMVVTSLDLGERNV